MKVSRLQTAPTKARNMVILYQMPPFLSTAFHQFICATTLSFPDTTRGVSKPLSLSCLNATLFRTLQRRSVWQYRLAWFDKHGDNSEPSMCGKRFNLHRLAPQPEGAQ